VLRAASILLLFTAALYLFDGFNNLVWHNPAEDLYDRWREQHYVFRGQNPYDIAFRSAAIDAGLPPPSTTRNAAIDPAIGASRWPDYPPWEYFSGYLFFPFPWQIERFYFAALNLLALAFLAGWIVSIGRPLGPWPAAFLVGSVLAISSIHLTLNFGQFGVLVVTLLAAALVLTEKNRPLLAGLLLGIALLKPNISAPFVLCFAARRQFRAIYAAVAYVVLASLVVWAITKTNPIEMMNQMMVFGRQWSIDRGSVLKAVVKLGVPVKQAIPLVAVTCMAVGSALVWWKRQNNLLTLYAIISPFGYIWTYHHSVDNLMILFILLCLGQNLLRQPKAINIIAFTAVGISLWIPLPFGYVWPIALALISIWFFGLFAVLKSADDAVAAPPAPTLSTV
jgi:hypothetical protein